MRRSSLKPAIRPVIDLAKKVIPVVCPNPNVTVTALASLLLAEWNAAAECHMYASNKRESAARLHRRRAKALAHRSVALRFYRRRATRARAGTNTNVTTSGGGGMAG